MKSGFVTILTITALATGSAFADQPRYDLKNSFPYTKSTRGSAGGSSASAGSAAATVGILVLLAIVAVALAVEDNK